MGEDEFSILAKQMVDKLHELKRRYPDTFAGMEKLQRQITEVMSKIRGEIASLSKKEEALLILYTINEIHKLVDRVFIQEWE